MKKLVLYIVVVASLASCSSYSELLKKGSPEDKYDAAKEFFTLKNYSKSIALFEDIVNYYRGTSKAEELLYMIAESHAGQKDWYSASEYYTTYIKSYPRGIYAQECRYMIAYCHYKDSPETKLDQSSTVKAIEAFQEFIDLYPESAFASEAYKYMAEMTDKLAEKGYLNAKLYYNLGNYLGNNYQSAIITANNTLREYPESRFRESLIYIVLAAKSKEAFYSVAERRKERYSEVIDEYYSYANEFPSGKHIKEADRILKEAQNNTK